MKWRGLHESAGSFLWGELWFVEAIVADRPLAGLRKEMSGRVAHKKVLQAQRLMRNGLMWDFL